MGLKITTDQRPIKVIRQDKESRSGDKFSTYSLMVTSKKEDKFINGFIECKFKKGVEVPNKSKIAINNAFYVVDEYNGKTYPKLMITDFQIEEEGETNNATPGVTDDGFMIIPDGDEIEVPFV